jgi:hypothetical protein
MLNFAYYQMTLVNVGQKGKVSTRKVYIDTLRNSLFYRGLSARWEGSKEVQCKEGK